jgi:hypothetical protein
LTGLAGEVVDNHGLNRHFSDVSRVGTVEFRTQNLWKVVLLVSSFLEGWTISSSLWDAGR